MRLFLSLLAVAGVLSVGWWMAIAPSSSSSWISVDRVIDFGVVAASKTSTRTVTIGNNGNCRANIRIRPTCSCLATEPPTFSIDPNGKKEISVYMTDIGAGELDGLFRRSTKGIELEVLFAGAKHETILIPCTINYYEPLSVAQLSCRTTCALFDKPKFTIDFRINDLTLDFDSTVSHSVADLGGTYAIEFASATEGVLHLTLPRVNELGGEQHDLVLRFDEGFRMSIPLFVSTGLPFTTSVETRADDSAFVLRLTAVESIGSLAITDINTDSDWGLELESGTTVRAMPNSSSVQSFRIFGTAVANSKEGHNAYDFQFSLPVNIGD